MSNYLLDFGIILMMLFAGMFWIIASFPFQAGWRTILQNKDKVSYLTV